MKTCWRKTFEGCAILVILVASGCQTDSRQQLLLTGKSQVELRSFQSRTFDTGDKERTLRAVIATLQDLSFVVDKADAMLGSVTASKLDHTVASLPYRLRITITVRPKGISQMIVRANATYNITPVEDPEPYQQFFTALSKAMFLEANASGGVGNPAPPFSSRQSSATETAAAQSFASEEARTAWHKAAKEALEQKYQRLLTREYRQRYSLGCDKSIKQAGTQACEDVNFQIHLLEAAKSKELALLEGQYRRATVGKSFPQQTPGQTLVEACDPKSKIDFARERKQIEEALSWYIENSQGWSWKFQEFKNITKKRVDCGKIELSVTFVVIQDYHFDISERTRDIVMVKKGGKFHVDEERNPQSSNRKI